MGTRRRTALAVICALAVLGLVVPAATARAAAVPKVGGLQPAGSYLTTSKLGVKWTRVSGASYQVRWAASTAALPKAKVYATTKTSAISPALSNVCLTWYAQVRAKKSGRFGAWSTARALKFSGLAGVTGATPITTGQTNPDAAQVRWAKKPGAIGYRAHYSPGPYGNWPGYFPYTGTTSATATGLTIPLPAVGSGDRFMGPEYGNPLFFQLETKRCNGTYAKSYPFSLVFPKAADPGSSATGDALGFGSYNVELFPSGATTKMANLADNIVQAQLDVVTLQEANKQTAIDLVAAMNSLETSLTLAADWAYSAVADIGGVAQQILYRTGKYTEFASGNIGLPADGTQGVESDAAKTPIPTPWSQLSPVDADPVHQDIIVVGVHLEDRQRFDTDATIAQRKADAHDAAQYLLTGIAGINPGNLPVIAAGDFKGTFGGGGSPGDGYCDESSTPVCQPEGQPTFIRGGFIDAQGAATKVGIEYGTVNKHVLNPPAAASGFGGRADFIVAKGFTGIAKYENVRKSYGDASLTQQSDHNLIYARFFIPHLV